MTIDFYYTPGSAPCRSVLLVAKALGLDLNLIHLDLMKGEQLNEDFVKLNPQHTVPTLNDNGFVLWESRAILTYLVGKYGKQDDPLYPNDVKTRAFIDQKLYFDMGTLYQAFSQYYYPVLFGSESFDQEKLKQIHTAFGFFETFLVKQSENLANTNEPLYIVGKNLTVADLTLVASVSTYASVDFDLSAYPNVERWYKSVQENAPGYNEANEKPTLAFKKLFDMIMSKKK